MRFSVDREQKMSIRQIRLIVSGTVLAALSLYPSLSSAQGFKTLYRFVGATSDGTNPWAAPVVSASGVLYGTTNQGGLNTVNGGTVYKLAPQAGAGNGWVESLVYTFLGQPDAKSPTAGVVIGNDGSLYGIGQGGSSGYGAVYRLRPPTDGGGSWTEEVIYDFMNTTDGAFPQGSLTIGPNGDLYGIANEGGSSIYYGTVFQLSPPSSAGEPWRETTIYNFQNGSDGSYPVAGLAMGKDLVFYGVTNSGGPGPCKCGIVFQLKPPSGSGGSWILTTLHTFQGGSDGAYPLSAIALDENGDLYGTTPSGGASNAGTVFKLTRPASANERWSESVLYSFQALNGGNTSFPNSVLVGSQGVLYGTTQYDGFSAPNCPFGCGTIFSLTPPAVSGATWTENTLYSFTDGADGGSPSSLAAGPKGALYGTTEAGGSFAGCFNGCGTVFAFKP